jgi:RND family efflux transporter MFP subunit
MIAISRIWVAVAALALAGCGAGPAATPHAHEEPDAHGHDHEQEEAIQRTVHAGGFELFAESPAEGTGVWLLHLTELAGWKPVTVEYCEAGGARGRNAQPGIVKIEVARESVDEVSCRIGAESVTFDVRGPADRPEPAAVRFLKEQQWTLPFETGFPERRTLRESLRIPAEFRARPTALAEVTAPLAGRVAMESTAVVGLPVKRGDVLASVLPPTPAAADLASIQLAREEAESAAELAARDLERAERLVEAGVAPAKRLDEAKAAARSAKARIAAADLRMQQYQSSSESDGREIGARRFLVRVPISGTVIEVLTPTGAHVETGAVLARIVDTATLHAVGFAPESSIPLLHDAAAAEIEMSDGTVSPAGRRVSIGRLLDPVARTLPVIYEVSNPSGRWAVHQAAHLRLWTKSVRDVLAVPEGALVDEGPQQAVYVQRGGETFVRRVVETGLRSEGWVEIRSGLRPRDRVVTKGAYLVKLASSAGQMPAGHVH